MSIDFTTLQALEIPEGVVMQIEDASGSVIWCIEKNKPIIIDVRKVTSNTYAGSTTYKNESFILLDIYPKTYGTVSVTYGGLTKTITDTSGAEEPNAQQVFFGTFNGDSDSVTTPESGELIIEGDCTAFSQGVWKTAKTASEKASDHCLLQIKSFGNMTSIAQHQFEDHGLLEIVTIGNKVTEIGYAAFRNCALLSDITIGNRVTLIGACAFYGCNNLTSITIPDSVKFIGDLAFQSCTKLKSIVFENTTKWYLTKGTESDEMALDVSDDSDNADLLTNIGSGYYSSHYLVRRE